MKHVVICAFSPWVFMRFSGRRSPGNLQMVMVLKYFFTRIFFENLNNPLLNYKTLILFWSSFTCLQQNYYISTKKKTQTWRNQNPRPVATKATSNIACYNKNSEKPANSKSFRLSTGSQKSRATQAQTKHRHRLSAYPAVLLPLELLCHNRKAAKC